MARRFERNKDEHRPREDVSVGGRRSHEEEGLSEDELALQHAETIPDRAALSTLKANVTVPLDPSVAADVLAGMFGEDADGPDEPSGEGAGEGRAPGSDG